MVKEFSAAVMAHLRRNENWTKFGRLGFMFWVVFFFFFFLMKWDCSHVHICTQRTVKHFDIWAIPKDWGFLRLKNLESLPATNHGATDQELMVSWSWLRLGEGWEARHLMSKPCRWLLTGAVMAVCAVWTPMLCLERMSLWLGETNLLFSLPSINIYIYIFIYFY